MPEIDQLERGSSSAIDRNMKSAMLTALIGYLGGCLLFVMMLGNNPSSTAAVGMLFVPLEMLKFVIPLLAFGYGFPNLMEAIRLIREKKPAKWKFSAVISLGLALCGMGVLGYGMGLTYAVAQARQLEGEDLERSIKTSLFKENKFVLAGVAENSQTTADQLDRIARTSKAELEEPLFSIWPVMGTNSRGLAVKRLVAQHANVSAETLEYLAKSSNIYVRSSVAQNAKTPDTVLRELARDTEFIVRRDIARNPRVSDADLSVLSDDPDERVRDAARSSLQERQGKKD